MQPTTHPEILRMRGVGHATDSLTATGLEVKDILLNMSFLKNKLLLASSLTRGREIVGLGGSSTPLLRSVHAQFTKEDLLSDGATAAHLNVHTETTLRLWHTGLWSLEAQTTLSDPRSSHQACSVYSCFSSPHVMDTALDLVT